jgi:hypothetical protein
VDTLVSGIDSGFHDMPRTLSASIAKRTYHRHHRQSTTTSVNSQELIRTESTPWWTFFRDTYGDSKATNKTSRMRTWVHRWARPVGNAMGFYFVSNKV